MTLGSSLAVVTEFMAQERGKPVVLDDGAESALEACDWFVRGAVKAGGEIRARGARRSSQEDKEEIDKTTKKMPKEASDY